MWGREIEKRTEKLGLYASAMKKPVPLYGGLNKNAPPQMLTCLNMEFPVGGTAWGGCGTFWRWDLAGKFITGGQTLKAHRLASLPGVSLSFLCVAHM